MANPFRYAKHERVSRDGSSCGGLSSRLVASTAWDEEDAIHALKRIKLRAKQERSALLKARRPQPSLPKFNLPPYVEEGEGT